MKTSLDIIERHNNRAIRMAVTTGANSWGDRHLSAWKYAGTNKQANAIVGFITALATYADGHYARYESYIGDDYFLGEGFAEMLQGVRTLLNGETGNLDCGTLDGMLLDIAAHNHINPDTFALGYVPLDPEYPT